jgi:hypothetical protein
MTPIKLIEAIVALNAFEGENLAPHLLNNCNPSEMLEASITFHMTQVLCLQIATDDGLVSGSFEFIYH